MGTNKWARTSLLGVHLERVDKEALIGHVSTLNDGAKDNRASFYLGTILHRDGRDAPAILSTPIHSTSQEWEEDSAGPSTRPGK